VVAAVAVGVFAGGGFSPESRGAFAAFAGLAALLAVSLDADRAVAAMQRLPVLALVGLAALTALSSIWTLGEPVRAIRWAMVIAGYAAVAVATATLPPKLSARLATVVALIAAGAACIGLWGIATRQSPAALHLSGEWEAAGPFQYPPALAWLQIAAVPVLLTAGGSRSWRTATAGSLGLALATMTIALAASRVADALALGLIALAVANPTATVRSERLSVLGLIGTSCAIPIAALTLTDLGNPDSPVSGDTGRALVLAGIMCVSVGSWASLRTKLGGRSLAPRPVRRHGLVVVGVTMAITCAMALAITAERSGPGVEPTADWSHGRVEQWDAALDTFAEHPLLGVGGEAYFRGSRANQGPDPTLYAHNLPLEASAELGVLGGALVLALFASIVALVMRLRARAWPMGAAAVLFLGVNLADWSWHLAGAGAIWALSVGILLGSSHESDEAVPSPSASV
jgi:hypothetical protein